MNAVGSGFGALATFLFVANTSHRPLGAMDWSSAD
jgi:hypothetical protein